MELSLFLILLFFVTALVYSSVGFGGGSTYLALLTLFSFSYDSIPKVALICNLIVVTGALYHFRRAQLVNLKRGLPFLISSIPLSYLGGAIPVSKTVFLGLLGISLLLAGLRLFFVFQTGVEKAENEEKNSWGLGLFIGGTLGFLSGLVGIGGGIFLAPLLYLMRWGNARQIAAMASLFIFINSLFGLAGQFSKTGLHLEYSGIYLLALAVFLGGQLGSQLSIGKLPLIYLQRVTASLILYAAGNIFLKLL